MIFAAPALPLHKAGPYVAAAYVVFVAIVLIYVVIMAVRTGRTERELTRLRHEVEAERARREEHADRQEETLTS
jgi:HAMP domain-containing protein